jgi:hypothetical protein
LNFKIYTVAFVANVRYRFSESSYGHAVVMYFSDEIITLTELFFLWLAFVTSTITCSQPMPRIQPSRSEDYRSIWKSELSWPALGFASDFNPVFGTERKVSRLLNK